MRRVRSGLWWKAPPSLSPPPEAMAAGGSYGGQSKAQVCRLIVKTFFVALRVFFVILCEIAFGNRHTHSHAAADT